MKGLARLGTLWNTIQSWLFPALEDELGELDEKHRLFVAVCEARAPGARMGALRIARQRVLVPPSRNRLALFKAFVPKALRDSPPTRAGSRSGSSPPPKPSATASAVPPSESSRIRPTTTAGTVRTRRPAWRDGRAPVVRAVGDRGEQLLKRLGRRRRRSTEPRL